MQVIVEGIVNGVPVPVTVTGGGGGGTAAVDGSVLTPGVGSETPIGGIVDDAAPHLVADGHTGVVRITAYRALHTNLRNNTGTEIGTLSNPVRINPTGTTAQPVELQDGVGNPISSTAGALNVAGSFTATPPTSNIASAPAQTAVGVTAAQVLAANAGRKRLMLQNTGTTRIKIVLGVGTPTQTAYHFCLAAGGNADDGSSSLYIDNLWIGAVQAISSAGGGTLVVTELT
jgi:hypothetical protein